MKTFMSVRKGIKVTMRLIKVGEDYCVVITGGDKPHIGCITLSCPRNSLKNDNTVSATTSVINVLGHKDDEVGRRVSHRLSAAFNKNVAAVCGIHINNAKADDIKTVLEITDELTERIVDYYNI